MVNNIKISEHFKLFEFQSRDTKEVIIVPKLIVKLEALRAIVCNYFGRDTPLVINSGYRTPEHNKAEGGADDSRHLYGDASDVANPNGLTIDLFAVMGDSVGFDGIGKYNGRVHFDTRGYKSRWDDR